MTAKKSVKHVIEEQKTEEPVLDREVTELISEAAYFLYEKSGFLHGNDERDWLQAEKFIHDRK